jgi:hypothetical protein
MQSSEASKENSAQVLTTDHDWPNPQPITASTCAFVAIVAIWALLYFFCVLLSFFLSFFFFGSTGA